MIRFFVTSFLMIFPMLSFSEVDNTTEATATVFNTISSREFCCDKEREVKGGSHQEMSPQEIDILINNEFLKKSNNSEKDEGTR